jgi:hypothetical protein
MPYEIKHVEGDGYDVINSETKDVKGHHENKEDAERQVRILNEVESNPEWEKEDAE